MSESKRNGYLKVVAPWDCYSESNGGGQLLSESYVSTFKTIKGLCSGQKTAEKAGTFLDYVYPAKNTRRISVTFCRGN